MAMAASLICLLAVLSASGTVASQDRVTPIAKVLQLMNDMAVKAQAEKNNEARKFAHFSQWCDDQTRVKTNEMKESNEKIEMLRAMIQKGAAHIRGLTDRIEELAEDVGRWKQDQKSAAEVREKEAADGVATIQDYSESLDALDGAILVLKKHQDDHAQAEVVQSLLQLHGMHLLQASSKQTLMAFLQGPDDDGLAYEAPEANAYEFQSSSVVEMLEKLKDQFGTKKRELEEEDMNNRHAFEQMTQQLTDNIENAENEISNKKILRAEAEKKKAEAEGDLAQTQADLDEDQKYLDQMTALCAQKRSDFESRSQLRADELAALTQAIEIISSKAVAGAGEAHLPTLIQLSQAQGASLTQLRGDDLTVLQTRISAFLADRAHRSNSQLLMRVSQQVASDPFQKVKKMIKNLIVKLMEEATEETERKGWCDTELTTNEQTRDKKADNIGKLTSEIDELKAEIMELTQNCEDLASAITELDEAMAKAAADRTASKDNNQQTVAEAKQAQEAVEQAVALLRAFYAKSAQATALAQQSPAMDAPETFDKPYQGMLPEGGGVIDILQVIFTDFARLESEATTSEATELEQYKNFMFESEKDKALKQNETRQKKEKITDDEGALNSAERELKTTQEQLEMANMYYDKLKPTCVDTGVSYAERLQRREEEIQSLQEALKILAGEDMA